LNHKQSTSKGGLTKKLVSKRFSFEEFIYSKMNEVGPGQGMTMRFPGPEFYGDYSMGPGHSNHGLNSPLHSSNGLNSQNLPGQILASQKVHDQLAKLAAAQSSKKKTPFNKEITPWTHSS